MSTTALIGDAYSTNFIETDCAQCNFGSYSTISSGFLDSNHIRLYQENDAKALMQVRWLVKGYLTDEEMSKYDL